MGEFPSGQRGQTVNLLSLTSVVRIHLPPPKIDRFRPVDFLSIAKAMVYHHTVRVYLITEGVYHQPQAAFLFAMMIYKTSF